MMAMDFLLFAQLVTLYPQNTEKVTNVSNVSNSNLYFSTDSFIIMKPLDQNEDPTIVVDFAAACIMPHKSNIVFSVPEKHRIYYWNGLETTLFIWSGDEGNNDVCAKKRKLFRSTGLTIEFDNVIYVVDSQSCVKIFTTLAKTAKFLETKGNLYKAFSVHEKRVTTNCNR